jgi:chorismate mutase/prephenate dehydratase
LCIVGSLAVEKYKLKTHAQKIENHSDNRTRFLIVGNQKISKTGKDKTSLLIQTNNKPGALVKLLKPFEEKKINLFRVETRPSRSTRDSHNFFIDSAGHQSDSKLQKVISTIRSDGAFVRMLGSYPDES